MLKLACLNPAPLQLFDIFLNIASTQVLNSKPSKQLLTHRHTETLYLRELYLTQVPPKKAQCLWLRADPTQHSWWGQLGEGRAAQPCVAPHRHPQAGAPTERSD